MEQTCKNIDELGKKFSCFVLDMSDFKIGRRIGKGGFSKVYAGLHISTGQICAVKVLNYKNLKKDRFLLYEREVQILAASRSPFLLGFVGFTLEAPYTIVTEYVPNGCLYNVIRPKPGSKILSGTEKTIIALGIANGMRRLHQLGIIHRDLKALNILLDKYYGPKIADFGLSRYQEEDQENFMTSNVGTAHWMAPELFNSGNYDMKVDLYSYGMLLWEILTGQSPFSGKNSIQIAVAVLKKQERPKFPKKTPAPLKELISQCWAQNPNKRPTFDDVYNAFSKHKAKYPDTDDKAVEEIVAKIKLNKYQKERKSQEIMNELPEDLQAVDHPKDIFKIVKETKKNEFPDPESPNFTEELNKASDNVNLDNVHDFFDNAQKLAQMNQPQELVSTVLKALVRLFQRNHLYVKYFFKVSMHHIPLYQFESILPDVCNVYLYVFSCNPMSISLDIINGITNIASEIPFQYLRLMNIYTCAQPQLPFFFVALNSLFNNSTTMIARGATIPYIQLLYTITQTADIISARHDDFLALFNEIFKMNDMASIQFVMNSMCTDKELSELITADQLATLMMIPNMNTQALSLAARLPRMTPTTRLVNSLLCNAQKFKMAAYILINFCQNEITANCVASQASSWINVPLPTLKITTKLVFTLLQFNNAKQSLSHCAGIFSFLASILQSGKEELSSSVLTIFKELPVSSIFLNLMKAADFLTKFYAFSTGKTGASIIAQCLLLTDYMGRIKYCPEFLPVIAVLKGLLADDGWKAYVITVLATLSCYKETHEEMINQSLVEMMTLHKGDATLGQYVDYFLANMNG